MRKITVFVIALLTLFMIVGCQSQTTETTTTETTQSNTISTTDNNLITTEEDIPSAIDLLDEEFAVGRINGTEAFVRTPLDPNYNLLIERKSTLSVGESYIEDFESDYLNSRIFPYRADKGASFTIADNVIKGKSLVITTKGDYSGAYLNGMQFSANSSYQISLDFRFLSGTSEFFFQFRSITGGADSDTFVNINNSSGNTGTYEFQVDLGNYNDYEIMIFPRFSSGVFAIDNINITRIDSKPTIKDSSINGELSIGNIVELDYSFYDPEGHEEGSSKFVWFTAMDQMGKNKQLIAENISSLQLTEDMSGKYIICQVTPISTGTTATNNIGNIVNVVSNRVPGDAASQVKINLEAGESFTEDFESDTDVINNIIFNEHDGGNAYIKEVENNKALYIESNIGYSGISFEGITLLKNQVYNLSFDYKILGMPNNIYVQARTLTGWVEHDKYYDISLESKTLETTYHFEGTFGLDGYKDYYFMIFFGSEPGSIVIDNLRVESTGETSFNVESVELAVGESIFETFDDDARYLGFDFSQVPNSGYTNDSETSISGESLYFESAGNYLCLFINNGLIYTENAVYRIEFDYRILTFVDTMYVQLNGGSFGNVFTEFGSLSEVNEVNHFSYDFELSNTTNYIIQVFPGVSSGNTKIVIDNIKIIRIS